jgi:hypothetical protein
MTCCHSWSTETTEASIPQHQVEQPLQLDQHWEQHHSRVDRKFKTFFHFIEMNFNGNITLVACQVKVIQKNGTADCE